MTRYRILTTKSIAERRKERDDAERARLEEIQRKTDLRNEFFNIDKKNKLDQVDLVEMGMVGGETVETSSIPENRNVKSQRFNDSASILGNVITRLNPGIKNRHNFFSRQFFCFKNLEPIE